MDWSKIVEISKDIAQDLYNRIGTPPTLRGLFYALVSKEIIPNTKNAYKRLSSVLVKARKNGKFPWELIKDTSRVRKGGDFGDSLNVIEMKTKNIQAERLTQVMLWLDSIMSSSVYFFSLMWQNQPKRVVIAVEKSALMDAISSFVSDYNVEVREMRGYTSATELYDLARLVKGWIDQKLKPVVLLVTDFDPSGEDIARYVKDELSEYGLDCEVEKVAVTLDQIKAYNLPSIPEREDERKKMMRDTRFKCWEHGFFRVETDALLAIQPEEFRRIMRDAVKKHFDEKIYNELYDQVKKFENMARLNLDKLKERLKPIYDAVKEMLEEVK